jgi:hypothetical protein
MVGLSGPTYAITDHTGIVVIDVIAVLPHSMAIALQISLITPCAGTAILFLSGKTVPRLQTASSIELRPVTKRLVGD